MSTPDIDLESLSDEERAALEGEDIGTLADAELAAKAAETISDDAEVAGDAPAPDVQATADAALDATPLAPRLAPPDVEGADERLNELLNKRKEVREQYRNGDLSADEKDTLEDSLNDQIADIRANIKNREFVESYNAQMEERDYMATVAAVKADIRRTDGIDYDKQPDLLNDWDARVRALAADPANADKSSRWFLEEAHRQTIAAVAAKAQLLGFKPGEHGARVPTNDERVREAVRDRRPPAGAKSLSGLPTAAADTGLEGAEFAHLDHLSGDDLEAAVARMTPDQQERWARA